MLKLVLLVLAPLVACAPPSSLFRDISYEAALAAAKKEEKVVLIDFFTTWCGPCKKLDATTWKDPEVLKWAEKTCIALKVDAEKHVNLAKGHQVAAYPTIVLLKPDGKEIDRLVGYRDPQRFLSEVKGLLAGKSTVEQAKEKLAGNERDPMARQTYAEELMQKGRGDEALAEYLWCFDHGLESRPSYGGVRRSFLLSSIARLGERHPPALEALALRRDSAQARLMQGSDAYDDLADVIALNRALAKPEATLALFDRMQQEKLLSPRLRPALARDLLHPLAEAKRFADLVDLVGDPKAYLDRRIQVFEQTSKAMTGTETKEDQRAEKESARRHFMASIVDDGATLHEALLVTGKKEDAVEVENLLIAFDASIATYMSLISSALSAGAVETAKSIADRGTAALSGPDRAKIQAEFDRVTQRK